MENFEDAGACLKFNFKGLFCFIFLKMLLIYQFACWIWQNKTKKMFSTLKNECNRRTDSEFSCPDYFAWSLVPESLFECQSSDGQEAHLVSGLHATPPVSVPNLTPWTLLKLFE